MPGNRTHYVRKSALSDAQKDLITALAILGFAIGGFLFVNPNGVSVYPGDGGLTWRTLPFIYATLLCILSLIYVAQSLQKMRNERTQNVAQDDDQQPEFERVVRVRRIGSLLLLLCFAATLKVFGFAVVAPILLFLLFRLYQRGHWKTDLMLSFGGGLALWVLFVPVLKMNLKGGSLDALTPILLSTLNAVGM